LFLEPHHNVEDGEYVPPSDATAQDDETLVKLIDPILEIMDKNNDGFITYSEYREAEVNTP